MAKEQKMRGRENKGFATGYGERCQEKWEKRMEGNREEEQEARRGEGWMNKQLRLVLGANISNEHCMKQVRLKNSPNVHCLG